MAVVNEVELPEFKPQSGIRYLDVRDFLDNPDAVILDIRTLGEYNQGHIRGAHCFPLFTNEQRAEVGTIYKRIGKDQAIEKGLEFVGERLVDFVREAKAFGRRRQFYLYCWRGGMRSSSMAWLLSTAGLNVSVLRGGYNSYRQFFQEQVARGWRLIVVNGYTGSGKTELLAELALAGEQVLDLEGLANHKGSAFGGIGKAGQPTNEMFINSIHDMLRGFDSDRVVWLEAESISVGACFIPNEFFALMTAAPYLEVVMPHDERVERLALEYGRFDREIVVETFAKIAKRMGFNNSKKASDAFVAGDVRGAIELALEYYDKGYQLSSKNRKGEKLGVFEISNHNHREVATELIEKFSKI